jgi:MFS family permease
MALIGMAFGMGFTLGPLFAYFAVPADGTGNPGPSPGFVAAGLSAVALAMAIFMLPESLNPNSRSAARKLWDSNAWKSVMQNRAVFLLLIGFFVCIFSFAKFETTLSLLIKGSDSFEQAPFDFTFKQVCLTFAAIGALVAIVQGGIVRRLAGFVPEKSLAISGALIEVVGFGLVSYAVKIGSVNWLFGSLAVIVAGYSFLQPSLYSLLSRWTDPSQQGKVLGVGQSVSAMARILGSALGIPMLKAFLYLPYVVGSVLMLVVAISVALASRTGRDFESE